MPTSTTSGILFVYRHLSSEIIMLPAAVVTGEKREAQLQRIARISSVQTHSSPPPHSEECGTTLALMRQKGQTLFSPPKRLLMWWCFTVLLRHKQLFDSGEICFFWMFFLCYLFSCILQLLTCNTHRTHTVHLHILLLGN